MKKNLILATIKILQKIQKFRIKILKNGMFKLILLITTNYFQTNLKKQKKMSIAYKKVIKIFLQNKKKKKLLNLKIKKRVNFISLNKKVQKV